MPDSLFDLFQGLLLIKIAFLVLSGMFVGFLLVVLKQSRAMQKVINDDGAASAINSIAFLNVVIGISIFVAALIIL